jgi:hypothetical protein
MTLPVVDWGLCRGALILELFDSHFLNTTKYDMKWSENEFRNIFDQVNTLGFSVVDLTVQFNPLLGEPLYKAMDAVKLHPMSATYYNEIAFYWPEDWKDVSDGIGCFHAIKDVERVYAAQKANLILQESLGAHFAEAIFSFAESLKGNIVRNHIGLDNNELRLSRVMIRQMNERHVTHHGAIEFHEDRGYVGRTYRQLLSAIVTTFGIPTEGKGYSPKVGELVIFNSRDRRESLGLDQQYAFIHRGPKSGPKMFFFFEFLGPS